MSSNQISFNAGSLDEYLHIKELPKKVQDILNRPKVKDVSPGDLERHPVSAAFPDLPEKEFEQLVCSIKLNGVRQPSLVLGGKVVDGWQRRCACLKAGVLVRVVELPPEAEPFLFQLASACNFNRRQMDAGQIALIAVSAESDFIKMGAERKKQNQNLVQNAGGGTQTETKPRGPDTAESLAAKYPTNETYIKDAIYLYAHGDQKIIEDVLNKTINIHKAAQEVRRTHPKPPKVRKTPKVPIPDYCQGRLRIIPGCPLEYLEKSAEGDAPAIATDCPPLCKVELKRFGELVSKALKPGGVFLLTFDGEASETIDDNLNLISLKEIAHGVISFDPEAGKGAKPADLRRFKLYFKPSNKVAAAKLPVPPTQALSLYNTCVVICGTEMQSWRTLLKLYVVDSYQVTIPFAGGGAVTAACVELGRRCIAIEADDTEVKRLQELGSPKNS
jgi:hypothetical protein